MRGFFASVLIHDFAVSCEIFNRSYEDGYIT